MNHEVRAQFLEELHRFGETIIALFKDDRSFKVKMKAADDELERGAWYSLYGQWFEHEKYGRQFQARTFIEVTPHDEAGILGYLKRCGVGKATAKKLWDLYGSSAAQQIREAPEKTVEELAYPYWKIEKAKAVAAELERRKATEDAEIELVGILGDRGFPRKLPKELIQRLGNRAGEHVRRNPYLLLGFNGVGFLRADGLYLELGHNPGALKRQTLCLVYAMATDMQGDTWFDPRYLERILCDTISSAPVRAIPAVKLGLRARMIAKRNGTPLPSLTTTERAAVERNVAIRAATLDSLEPRWPDVSDLDVSEHQKGELQKALAGRIGIFCGSPGTGKTYTAARLIKRILEGPKEDSHKVDVSLFGFGSGSPVAVVAPTGKAAVRITEALEEHGVPIKASTIHSYLGVGSTSGGDWSFKHGPENPVQETFIVVDEASMIDVTLMSSLLAALPDTAHLLLVGDTQQLPPVGHGAPLRDLTEAGFPLGELREIRRNAGAIVETCARIRDQEDLELPTSLDLEEGRNLMHREISDGDRACDTIMNLVRRIRDNRLADPTWETQVIVAVNKKSALSREHLNSLLQVELNSHNRAKGRFWSHDKIVCLKNQTLPPADEDDLAEVDETFVVTRYDGSPGFFVANGELGRVVEDLEKRLILEFFNPPRIVVVPKGPEKDGDRGIHFDLGYAISCHKSQGSEWPIVLVAIDDHRGARMVCDRSWIYTAISRAKKACITVGREDVLRDMIRTQKIHYRKTFLTELLKEEAERVERSRKEREEREEERGLANDPACA